MRLCCRRWNIIANRSEFWYLNYKHHVDNILYLQDHIPNYIRGCVLPEIHQELLQDLIKEFLYASSLIKSKFSTALTKAEFVKQFSTANGAMRAYSLLVSVFQKSLAEIDSIFVEGTLTKNMNMMEFTMRRYLMQFEAMFPQHKPLICATDAILDEEVLKTLGTFTVSGKKTLG